MILPMEFDPEQRRRAFQAFMDRENIKVSAWEKAADIGGGTLRKFMDGTSTSLTERTFHRLLTGATALLGKKITAADIETDGQLSLVEQPGRPAPAPAPARRPASRKATKEDGPDLQVFATAAGGPEGAWILSSEPVAWVYRDSRLVGIPDAFACYVVGDSMERAYEQGNLLLVNPTAPPTPGDDALLVQTAEDGERYALIKRLVSANSSHWTVRQWNPDKTFKLSKKEWQEAMLVIGKYNRG